MTSSSAFAAADVEMVTSSEEGEEPKRGIAEMIVVSSADESMHASDIDIEGEQPDPKWFSSGLASSHCRSASSFGARVVQPSQNIATVPTFVLWFGIQGRWHCIGPQDWVGRR